jgi:hypothetical protein
MSRKRSTSWSTTSFLELMASEEARRKTDYAISQRAGVRGFPTLVAGPTDAQAVN